MRTSSPCATSIGSCAAGTFKNWPKARKYKDYRRLLDQSQDIDAVMVATPDHMHAPVTVAALRAGKHVYVEKPMAHSIEEARAMTALAKTSGLVTQMGNQGHAGEGLRLTREWIQRGRSARFARSIAGATARGTSGGRTSKGPRTPARAAGPGLGPLARRGAAAALSSDLLPVEMAGVVRLRHRALGDMAIHNMDPAFYALDLGGLRLWRPERADCRRKRTRHGRF